MSGWEMSIVQQAPYRLENLDRMVRSLESGCVFYVFILLPVDQFSSIYLTLQGFANTYLHKILMNLIFTDGLSFRFDSRFISPHLLPRPTFLRSSPLPLMAKAARTSRRVVR